MSQENVETVGRAGLDVADMGDDPRADAGDGL
jgi:hypothetical protein